MKIETNNTSLQRLGRDFLDGLAKYKTPLAIPQEIETGINDAMTELSGALATLSAKTTVLASARAKRTETGLIGRKFVQDAYASLRILLGHSWTESWGALRVPRGSIGVPKGRDEVVARLQALIDHLTAQPDHETANRGITVANATKILGDIDVAEAALKSATIERRTAAVTRDEANDQLRKKLRYGGAMLGSKLASDDVRWGDFGLPRPVDERIPTVPQGLVVTSPNAGEVRLTWNRATRATRYRIFLQAPEDQQANAVQTVRAPDAHLSGMRRGVKLRFTVTAANGARETLPSTPVEITLP